MRLITYASIPAGAPRIGVRVGHRVLDIEAASRVDGEPLPNSMRALLREGRGALSRVQALARKAQSDAGRFAGALVEERSIRLLPPVPDPDKFVRVGAEPGKNDVAGDAQREVAGFAKLDSFLVGHGAKVAVPPTAKHLDCGPALVFVIGKRALRVKGDEAMDCAVGVTLLNDLADRGLQEREADPKGAQGSAALGPEIVTMDEIPDPYDLWITCSVNGEERMRGNTREQARRLPEILEHFSRTGPIEPGDMFCTGAPGRLAPGRRGAKDLFLKPGDVVECSIEGVATLRTLIVSASAS